MRCLDLDAETALAPQLKQWLQKLQGSEAETEVAVVQEACMVSRSWAEGRPTINTRPTYMQRYDRMYRTYINRERRQVNILVDV